MSPRAGKSSGAADYDASEDAAQLEALGYKQELHRRFGGFANFAVSFSIISVLAGCITSYLIAMNAGGPVAISIGWPLVGVFVVCVALSMAEICSVYPTAAGLYFWAGRLARTNKRQWAWVAGDVQAPSSDRLIKLKGSKVFMASPLTLHASPKTTTGPEGPVA